MSGRVSGLSDAHARHARELIAKAARTMVANKRIVHYTQGSRRWEGISRRMSITRGEYPKYCDCSSNATWMLWDAMARPYGVRDLVNHTSWRAGYTGSMYQHGKQVYHDKNLKIGDLIFYGNQGGGVPKHVAVYVGGGMVFSHGNERGPFIVRLDYRNDRRMSRRYI
jgi:hypothetical protein